MTGVLSNQVRGVIDIPALKYDLLEYIEVIVGDEDLEKSRPHAQALLQLLRMLDPKPEEVLL